MTDHDLASDGGFIEPVSMEEGLPELFPGDRGVLDPEVRRTLALILHRRFLLAERNRQEWRTLLDNQTVIESRLNDLYIRLIVDHEHGLAYKQQIRVDELDIPEIVFQTYCGTDVSTNGALRAIHGGGASRGHDFFAVLGPTTTWHEGDPLPATTTCANGDLNSTSAMAAGDLDGDGVPEIVSITENSGIAIVSNTGTRIATSANNLWTGYTDSSPSIANGS